MQLSDLRIEDLSRQCSRESARYFRGQDHDPRYCFELFRRAFVEHSQAAWEQIYGIYQRLVTGWVASHQAFAGTGEEAQYFVNRAFEKMWASIPAAKFPRFKDLSSLLRYLKMCVASVIIDYNRAQRKLELEELTGFAGNAALAGGPAIEEQVIYQIEAAALWQQVRALAADEQEYGVLYGSFVLGLKPAEIHATYPARFENVKQIYRLKENLLAKIRRHLDPVSQARGPARK